MGEFTETAKSVHEMSKDAGEVLTAATTETAKLIESLREHADAAARDAVAYIRREVAAHPRASLAATAATAIVAAMGLFALSRRGKHAR